MGIKPENGDWIVGISPKRQGNKLVYAMRVDETLHFNQYFHDERFHEKKPDMNGPWEKRCGDNFYYQNDKGKWIQKLNAFHDNERDCKKDTKHPFVFISNRFFYFGENEVNLPEEFTGMILDRHGCKKILDQAIIKDFVSWLEEKYPEGIIGKPKDRHETCLECY
jgi:hypothetical protein